MAAPPFWPKTSVTVPHQFEMAIVIKPASASASASVDVVLCCAANFAREGRYDSAERLLTFVPAELATAGAFDLLARIYAQQGRCAEAEVQWAHAIQRDPHNEEYQRCLRAARQYRLRPWLRFRWAVALLLIVCSAISITIWRLDHQKNGKNVVETAPSTSVRTSVPRTETQTDAIRFNTPIFSVGTRLTDAGKQEIRQFAKQLNPQSRIEIEGQTDSQAVKSGSRYRDNEELGLARANAVALFLHREARLPLNQITVVSRPKVDRPCRADPSLRTVVIRFRGKGT